ncbi:MAG: TPR repeat-containing protein YrrB [Chloroflexi bacterium ADurb.Bin344]|nr:MAG: TPR repeat-containing protein YrrB [Chloroflexi bacterium ADurb.Bin344]
MVTPKRKQHKTRDTKEKAGKKPDALKHQINAKNLFFGSVLILTTYLIYRSVATYEFVNWDDKEVIINNPLIKDFSFQGIYNIFTHSYITDYRPLSYLVYAVLFRIWELNPAPYHVINVLFHILNAFLVFVFIKRLMQDEKIAFFSALVFAAHPMHVESVAWVSAFNDVFYTFFFLLSILYYLKYQYGQKKYYYLSLLFFVLSCFAKPLGIVLPFVLILLDYYNEKKPELKLVFSKWPFFVLMLLFALITVLVRKGDITHSATAYNFIERMMFASYALFYYTFSFFYPLKLSAIHEYPVRNILGYYPIEYYFAPFVLGAFLAMLFFIRNIRKEIIFGLGFFIINLVIVLQIIPFGNNSLIAERYTYISYIGLTVIAGHYLRVALNNRRLASTTKRILGVLIVLYLSLLSYNSFQHVKVWQSSITLWDNVLKKNAKNVIAYNSRAQAKFRTGDFYGCINDLNKSLDLNDTAWLIYNNRGLAYSETGDLDAAIDDFEKALIYGPKNTLVYINRAKIYHRKNNFSSMKNDLDSALAIEPNNIGALSMRATAYFNLKRYPEAMTDLDNITQKDASNADAFINKGNINALLENYPEAIDNFSMAITIKPDNAVAYKNRGLLYYNTNDIKRACADWAKALNMGHMDIQQMYNANCLNQTNILR